MPKNETTITEEAKMEDSPKNKNVSFEEEISKLKQTWLHSKQAKELIQQTVESYKKHCHQISIVFKMITEAEKLRGLDHIPTTNDYSEPERFEFLLAMII